MANETVPCPRCSEPTVLLWQNGQEARCPDCAAKRSLWQLGGDADYSLVIGPRALPDGRWGEVGEPSFARIRAILDGVLNPPAQGVAPMDSRTVEALMHRLEDLLEATARRDPAAAGVQRSAVLRLRQAMQHQFDAGKPRAIKRDASRDRWVLAWHLEEGEPVLWRRLESGGYLAEGAGERRERLKFLLGASPSRIYSNSQSHHLVFVFGEAKPVILESPFQHGALYLLPAEGWRILARQSLTELAGTPGVSRLTHQARGWRVAARGFLERAGLCPAPLVARGDDASAPAG